MPCRWLHSVWRCSASDGPTHRASQRHLLAVPRCSEARRYVVGHSAAAVARFLGRIESKPLWDVSYECGFVIHVRAAVWPSRIDRIAEGPTAYGISKAER